MLGLPVDLWIVQGNREVARLPVPGRRRAGHRVHTAVDRTALAEGAVEWWGVGTWISGDDCRPVRG